MRNLFIQYIKSFDFIKDFFLLVLGAAVSYLWNILKKYRRIYNAKKEIKKSAKNHLQNGIISLANAYPYYYPENIILVDSGERFILERPSNINKASNIGYNDFIFVDGENLGNLGERMGILDFNDLVNKHRVKVENDFANENGRELFNNEKYGVRKIVFTKTGDVHENSIVKIQFYKTDYFTHKVMRSIFKELLGKNHPISNCSRVEDIVKYYPFLTSFGINSLLSIMDENLLETLVLVKRSKHMANMSNDQWHVSMNEGLSLTDIDDVINSISFQKCVNRGFLEELGINNEHHIIQNEYHDIFLVTNNFELGITTQARIEMSIDSFANCFYAAEDRTMETTGEYKLLPATKKEVETFLRKNNSEMTDICKYCLEMFIARKH